MNKNQFAGLLGGAFLLLAGTAYADGITHVWECEVDEDATYEQLEAVSKKWTDAARKIDGVGNLEVYLEYPMAGEELDEFLFVMSVPSATAWGAFMDGYEGSEAQEVDEEWGEIASCDEAMIFRSVSMQ